MANMKTGLNFSSLKGQKLCRVVTADYLSVKWWNLLDYKGEEPGRHRRRRYRLLLSGRPHLRRNAETPRSTARTGWPGKREREDVPRHFHTTERQVSTCRWPANWFRGERAERDADKQINTLTKHNGQKCFNIYNSSNNSSLNRSNETNSPLFVVMQKFSPCPTVQAKEGGCFIEIYQTLLHLMCPLLAS